MGAAATQQPDDALLNQLAAAFAAGDDAGAVRLLRDNHVTDHDLCGSTLKSAISAGAIGAVRYVFEEAKMQLSPESCMLLVLDACHAEKTAICAYLADRTADAGATLRDGYNVILERLPAAEHSKLARLAAAKPEGRQNALDALLQATGDTKKFAGLNTLLAMGADVNTDGGKVLIALAATVPEELKDEKEKYLRLVDVFLSAGYEPDLNLDSLLAAAAMLSAGGLQHTELPEILIRHGADPWFDANNGWHALPDKARAEGRHDDAERWEEIFFGAKENITKTAAQVFETLFGDDFRIADLRPVALNGETGLMLAAKARKLDQVMATAAREGGTLTPEDLVDRSENHLSVLSRAADRGDAAKLLNARYWQQAAPELLQTLDSRLHDADKDRINLQGLKADFDHQKLKAGAARYKLSPGG